MRNPKPLMAVLSFTLLTGGLSVLSGCGGGGSSSKPPGVTTPVTTPVISPTFTTGNAPPGVQSGATGTSGSGTSGTTTSGTNPGSSTPVVTTQIDLQPGTATIDVNRQLTFAALAKDASGNPVTVPDTNWKWTSSNPAVALLTSAGAHATVSGVAPGTATISVVEGKSGVTVSATLTVIAAGTGTGSAPGGSGIGGGATGSGPINGGPATGGPTAASTLFYANDFAGGAGKEWSSTTIDTTPGTALRPPTKFLGQFAAGTVSLSLASLPTHSNITVEFDLFIIRTWDGNNPVTGIGPDIFDLSVASGPTLLHTTFANITPPEATGFPGSVYQAFPDSYPGGSNLYQSGAASVGDLGYTHTISAGTLPSDAVYHLKYTFPHTASTVKFNFTSGQTQIISDESWGLKNVQVTTNP